ncbi:hypothetical protein GCK72_017631 [Caenorhabditis remanei]|uniref:RRM domain-containing protein n=2 Tax=Caenorhabditis remanei TaxID=31234 RepID=A0A6A5G984_CAERE|nr:hypothetical protein GCK72_017631 [Caenorhabditis remanei]KAF1751079.1 hypothetical protein GCK72_017631 [Caenorhabditis remanei]
MDLEIDEQDQDRSPTPQSSISENSGSERGSERGSETPIDTPDTIETIEPVIISALPVTQLPAISLSGNNAQRTLWIGDVPTDWTEDTLNQVFTESGHPPYKVKRVYVKEELKGYCFIEFITFEEARQTLFDLNGVKIPGFKDIRYNLCFANDSYNPNSEFNLHVSGVPDDMADAELYRIFDKYHSCRGAKMFRFVDGSSKGSGFVRFGNQTDQQMALVEMHRTRVGNTRIAIKLAGSRGERIERSESAPYKQRRNDRRRDEKPSQYRNGTVVPQQQQVFDAYGNPVIVPVDKNIYGTDHPWAPFPDDADLDPIIGLDLLTTKYRPQIANKRLMIDTDQFMLDLESSRWSSIAFKTNIKKEDFEKRLIDNPWTPIP